MRYAGCRVEASSEACAACRRILADLPPLLRRGSARRAAPSVSGEAQSHSSESLIGRHPGDDSELLAILGAGSGRARAG